MGAADVERGSQRDRIDLSGIGRQRFWWLRTGTVDERELAHLRFQFGQQVGMVGQQLSLRNVLTRGALLEKRINDFANPRMTIGRDRAFVGVRSFGHLLYHDLIRPSH